MFEITPRKRDQIAGSILGGAGGDAFGLPFEGHSSPANIELNGQRISDDTQLTLATCEALIESDCIVKPPVIAGRFASWHKDGRIHGMGASTYKALSELLAGGHWALVGRKGEYAAGNGAAMRIAPLAFCLNPREPEAKRSIRDVSRITHHNEEAYAGALAVAIAVRAAWDVTWNGESDLILAVLGSIPDSKVRDRLAELGKLEINTPIVDVARRFGSSGYVVESVPLAIFAAQQVAPLGYLGVIRELIRAGGDTDTTASITGQIVGTLLGLNNLPMSLLIQLHDFTFIEGVVNHFVASVAAAAD